MYTAHSLTALFHSQPYVPAYDTVADYRIPDWLADTVHTRNEVTVRPGVLDRVRALQGQLVQFRDAPEAFVAALTETLQAEVRSKFQTSRRMENSSEGVQVEVLFDEAVVKYNWLAERVFEVTDVELVRHNRYIAEEAARLAELPDPDDPADGKKMNHTQSNGSMSNGSNPIVESDGKLPEQQPEQLEGDGVDEIENNTELSF